MKDLEARIIELIDARLDARLATAERKSLHTWRVSKGLKQEELAELSGVARPTISQIELGRRAQKSTLQKLAKALGIQPERIAV